MAYFIQKKPFVVPTTDGRFIEEHIGLASTGETALSIAHMPAPPGWSEPYQAPVLTNTRLSAVVKSWWRWTVNN